MIGFFKVQEQNRGMRWLLFCLLMVSAARAAEPGEPEAFAAAAKASQDGFFERAEKEWADFVGRYPKSERVNEAYLSLAQARHQLKQYSSALQTLNGRLPEAGALADQFRFWRGQTFLDMTNFVGADEAFAELITTHTNSPLRLNAAVGQGTARFRRDDFAGVVALLGNTNGIFQTVSRDSTNGAQVARGFLMLAESQMRRNDPAGARASLLALGTRTLPPETDWERLQLLARAEFAGPSPEAALPALTNALAKARAANRVAFIAQTLTLEADVHKRLNQSAQAMQAYEGIVTTVGMPQEQKRLALLKQVELAGAQNAFTNAAGRIALYLTQNPQEPSADQLNIKAGEFLLEAYRAETNKVSGAATNLIAESRRFFDTTLQRHTNSPAIGKAWLDRGWTLWEEHEATGNGQRLAESQVAFQNAAEKLPGGEEQAQARVKLGETQFRQGVFAGASTNFEAVLGSFESSRSLRTNLVAQAAELLIRSQLALTNLAGAEKALERTVALFQGSAYVQQNWLTMGQALAEMGQLEKARSLLKDFGAKFPESPLKADAELAYARTFAVEQKWPEAIDLAAKWAAANPAHPGLARAEFDRAWFYDRAGQETNAFQTFTNFVARFPTNELAALAQNWIGNYYFNPPREQWNLAEQNYQRVFLSTNWHNPELACQTRLAAARAAFLRQGYADALGYLTNLISTESACSQDVVAEAWILMGDVLIEYRAAPSTNSLANFQEALNAFERVTRMGPTNRFEPLAWGKLGDTYLQLGAVYPESYDKATNFYANALESKRPDVPVRARNQAEVGIALALEKMAEARPEQRALLLKAALDRHLNVVYRKGLTPDPYWQKRAAQNAGRLAEMILPPADARKLYTRLMEEIPSMKTAWQARRDALPASSVE